MTEKMRKEDRLRVEAKLDDYSTHDVSSFDVQLKRDGHAYWRYAREGEPTVSGAWTLRRGGMVDLRFGESSGRSVPGITTITWRDDRFWQMTPSDVAVPLTKRD